MKRQITIYESSKNGKITVLDDVEVNTLGELKTLLRGKGVDVDNKEFVEGVTNTKLLGDDSQIPTNIPYKGQVTNDVFINVLNKDTKIKSGVNYSELSRSELLRAAKPYASEIEKAFGVNYTRAKSADIAGFLNKKDSGKAPEAPAAQNAPAKKEDAPAKAPKADNAEVLKKLDLCKKAIEVLAEECDVEDTIADIFSEWNTPVKEEAPAKPEEPKAPKSNFGTDFSSLIRRG